MTAKKSFDLEDAMQQLEALVTKMESGELSLEASLATFKKGIELGKQCQQALDRAEQQVRILAANDKDAPLDAFQETSSTPATNVSTPAKPTPDNEFDDDIPF